MPIQTATTGQLEDAMNTVIAEWRFTAEANAPCVQLIDRYTLPNGNSTYRFPKVGQATFSALTDGIDLVDSQNIGLTYVDAQPSEVGAKFVLTDKLVRQASADAFKVIGRQLGDGMGRKRDEDVIVLFASLNSAWGADNATLGLTQASALVGMTKAYKFPAPIYCVHHPNAIATLAKNAVGIGTTYYPGLVGDSSSLQNEIMKNFFKMSISGVMFFEDGNIAKIGAVDSAYGAIFSKSAMACVESQAPTTARERDESLRGTEIIMVSDYIMVEVDGGYGGSARYEIGDLVTS